MGAPLTAYGDISAKPSQTASRRLTRGLKALTLAGIFAVLNGSLFLGGRAGAAHARLVGEGQVVALAEAEIHVVLFAVGEDGRVAHVDLEEAGSLWEVVRS